MRVLHILAGDLWGGREAQMDVQLAALRAGGIDAHALLFNSGIVAERYRAAGIPVVVCDESQGLRKLVTAVRRTAADLRPSVIVAHGYKESFAGASAARALGLPFVIQFHGAAEPYPGLGGLKMKAYELLTRMLAFFFADRIVCVSNALARTLRFSGSPKLRVIYNASTNVAPGEGEALYPGPASIACIGRLVQVKRFDLAIRAVCGLAKEVPARLFIVGNGPEEERLRALAASDPAGERVSFLGFRDNAAAHLGEAKMLLISSDSEGIPTVLLDAIRLGVPVVSTAVGGIPEVLDCFPGYPACLTERGDADSLRRGIERMLSTSSPAADSRHATLDELFSPASASTKQAELYRECLTSRRRAQPEAAVQA